MYVYIHYHSPCTTKWPTIARHYTLPKSEPLQAPSRAPSSMTFTVHVNVRFAPPPSPRDESNNSLLHPPHIYKLVPLQKCYLNIGHMVSHGGR